MNNRHGGRGRWLPASAAGLALLTAACGATAQPPQSSPPPRSAATSGAPATSSPAPASGAATASAGTSTYQRAVAYAQCMRQHDVPNFPDPLPNGGFELGPAVTGGTNGQVSPQYQAAENACAALNPVGVLSPQQQQQSLSRLLKVSACMRAHGFKKFPDPSYSSAGIELHIVGFDRSSPQFQSAWRACTAQAGTQGNAA